MEETKIIRIVVDSSRAIDGTAAATRAMQALERQAATMGGAFDKIQTSLQSMGSWIKGALAIELARIGAHFFEMGRGALEAAGNMGELAEQMGITVRGLQALQFVAVQNNLKLEELQTGVAKFSQKMGEAANGSKTIIDALDRLGVKIIDANGKLIPTETNMQRVAAAIVAIEDPAKRTTAQVEFFGKAGSKMAASLKDISEGFGVMGDKAQRAGAMLSDHAIAKLDALGDAAERSKRKFQTAFAEFAAPIATAALEAVNAVLAAISRNLGSIIDFAKSAARSEGASGIREFRLDPLNKRYDDALGVYNFENNKLNSMIASQGRNPTGAGAENVKEQRAKAQAAYAKLYQVGVDRYNAVGQYINYAVGSPDEPTPVSGTELGYKPRDPIGVTNGTSTEDAKAAESLAEKIQKLKDSLGAAAAAQSEMTKAARAGDVAFQEQQAKADALAKAIDTFGGKLDATNPKVKALAAELEKPMLEKLQGQAAQTFVVATTELTKQNELLAAQIALMNQSPEIQARELAIIKAKQEAQKAGNALTAEDVENRRRAIEDNERLKIQAEKLREAQQLWTEPLKQALRDIQSTAANAFESMLANGNFSFQSLGDAFKVTVRRMIAEFMALATVRPIMSVMVQGLSGLGIVSPAMATSLGYPAGTSFPGGGGSGFSLPQMPGGTSSGGMFGSFFGYQPFASAVPAGGFDSIDDLLASGRVAGTGFSSLSIGDLLGGIGSIGMGAFNLISGKGSTGSVIGGLSGIIGGGMSLAASAGLIGSAFGPIGMGIGLIGGLLGGLLGGGGEPPIPPQPALNLGIGSFLPTAGGSYAASGYGLNGGGSLATQAGGLGSAVSQLFRQAGLKGVPGQMIGGRIWSGVDHVLNGRQWSDRPYTQVALVNPGADDGGGEYITYNDSSRNLQQAADLLVAAVFKANVLRGGVSGASAALKAGLTGYDPQTAEATQNVVTLAVAYDKLGKAATPVKDAIDKITASFDELREFAEKASLSLAPINAEVEKQTKRVAQDFIDSMLDPLAVQMRALEDERKVALESAQYIRDNIEGVYVDMDRIATYYINKRAALEDQYYQGAVTNLQNLINRLTYGDLANPSAATTFAGTSASYSATLAQARAGNASAIANLPGIAEAYASSARGYFASSPEYEAIRQQIAKALAEVVAQTTGGAATGSNGSPVALSAEAQTALAANDQLREMVHLLADKVDKLTENNAALVAQLRSRNTNGM